MFLKQIENMYSVFLSSYRNTHESLGEFEKAVETLTCGLCSHSISRSPKLPLVPYPHCILITSSHKIKLWEESAPALATTTTTHKLANNTGAKRFQHDSPLILSMTQIPLNNHNSKRNFKTKGGGLAKHNARGQYKANIMI